MLFASIDIYAQRLRAAATASQHAALREATAWRARQPDAGRQRARSRALRQACSVMSTRHPPTCACRMLTTTAHTRRRFKRESRQRRATSTQQPPPARRSHAKRRSAQCVTATQTCSAVVAARHNVTLSMIKSCSAQQHAAVAHMLPPYAPAFSVRASQIAARCRCHARVNAARHVQMKQ